MEAFKRLNPTVEIKEETEHLNIYGLWNDSSLMCRYKKDQDLSSLNTIQLPEEFSAIIHTENKQIEFIFSPLNSDEEIINREFSFNYNNESYTLSYKESSEVLKLLATGFHKTEEDRSETYHRNLGLYKGFLREDKPPRMEEFFKNKIPISFFVEGDISKIEDLKSFSKHVNFYMNYYHRKSPSIVIFTEKQEKEVYNEFCHTIENGFPNHINSVKIDPVILDLFEIATNTSSTRMKYIFYYQVLEYFSYYYLNFDLKIKLNNVVKNPDIINNADKYSKILIEEFKDYFKSNNDKQKLEKLVATYCSYSDIESEICANPEYFSKDLEFEGGFKLDALLNKPEEAKNPHKDILKSVVDRIDRIRNVLVHIRESRENKVILATNKNNDILIPYLFLIRRISEVIAIKYD